MTAPAPEKIQRYDFDEKPGLWSQGDFVLYADHLRHLKLTQIEVLEELLAHMRSRYTSEANPTGSYCNEESLWIAEKIAALRKELEG